MCACNSSCVGGRGRMIEIWDQPWQKHKTLFEKYLKAKRAGCVAQVVELLLSKPGALSSALQCHQMGENILGFPHDIGER
jgi:hypothetical protein